MLTCAGFEQLKPAALRFTALVSSCLLKRTLESNHHLIFQQSTQTCSVHRLPDLSSWQLHPSSGSGHRPWSHPQSLSSHIPNPILWPILLITPSEYFRFLSASLYLHHFHPGSNSPHPLCMSPITSRPGSLSLPVAPTISIRQLDDPLKSEIESCHFSLLTFNPAQSENQSPQSRSISRPSF